MACRSPDNDSDALCVSSAVHGIYVFDLEKRIFPLMILRLCCHIDLYHLVGPLIPTEHVHVATRPKQSFTFFRPTIYNSTSLKVRLEVKLWRRTTMCGSLNDRAGPVRRMSVELFGKGDSKSLPLTMSFRAKSSKLFGLPCAGCLTLGRAPPYSSADMSADIPAGCLSVLCLAYPDSWFVTFRCPTLVVGVDSVSPSILFSFRYIPSIVAVKLLYECLTPKRCTRSVHLLTQIVVCHKNNYNDFLLIG